jgi:hypothetical protein
MNMEAPATLIPSDSAVYRKMDNFCLRLAACYQNDHVKVEPMGLL